MERTGTDVESDAEVVTDVEALPETEADSYEYMMRDGDRDSDGECVGDPISFTLELSFLTFTPSASHVLKIFSFTSSEKIKMSQSLAVLKWLVSSMKIVLASYYHLQVTRKIYMKTVSAVSILETAVGASTDPQ